MTLMDANTKKAKEWSLKAWTKEIMENKQVQEGGHLF